MAPAQEDARKDAVMPGPRLTGLCVALSIAWALRSSRGKFWVCLFVSAALGCGTTAPGSAAPDDLSRELQHEMLWLNGSGAPETVSHDQLRSLVENRRKLGPEQLATLQLGSDVAELIAFRGGATLEQLSEHGVTVPTASVITMLFQNIEATDWLVAVDCDGFLLRYVPIILVGIPDSTRVVIVDVQD